MLTNTALKDNSKRDGEMTGLLRPHFARRTAVDAAHELFDCIPDGPDLRKDHALGIGLAAVGGL